VVCSVHYLWHFSVSSSSLSDRIPITKIQGPPLPPYYVIFGWTKWGLEKISENSDGLGEMFDGDIIWGAERSVKVCINTGVRTPIRMKMGWIEPHFRVSI
jgi:hypothetical protein